MADHSTESMTGQFHTDTDDVDQFTYINWVLPRGSCGFDEVMDDRLKAVELGRPSDDFHTINHVTMAEKEPGFGFPVDAPECCHHHVRRRRKEKTRDENQALYSTRGQLPAGRTKGGIISPVAGR